MCRKQGILKWNWRTLERKYDLIFPSESYHPRILLWCISVRLMGRKKRENNPPNRRFIICFSPDNTRMERVTIDKNIDFDTPRHRKMNFVAIYVLEGWAALEFLFGTLRSLIHPLRSCSIFSRWRWKRYPLFFGFLTVMCDSQRKLESSRSSKTMFHCTVIAL